MALSDSEFSKLIYLVQHHHDEWALSALLEDARPVIYSAATTQVENIHDVEDLTQECLIKMSDFKNLQKFESRHSYRAWKGFLNTEVYFRVRDHWRKENRTPEPASWDDSDDNEILERFADQEMVDIIAKENQRARCKKVRDILQTVGSKRDRAIALLFWVWGLSQSEIARRYNISVTYVSTIIARMKKGVREKMNYCLLLPSWIRDITERIAHGLLLTPKQAALWIVPQMCGLFLVGVTILWVGLGQEAKVVPPHSGYAPGWVAEVQFYPLTAPKPPLTVSPVDQSSRGESSDSAQKTDADSRADRGSDQDIWFPTSGPYGGSITALHSTPEGVLFSGTLSDSVFRSKDGGRNWQPASEGLGDNSTVPSVYAFVQNGDTLYADTAHGFFYTVDGGELWQELTYSQEGVRVSELAIIDDTIYVTRVREGGVFVSTDDGRSWSQINNGLTDEGQPKLFTSGSTLFAQMDYHVFRLNAGEQAWSKLIIKNSSKKAAVESDIRQFVVSGEIIYAVTADGGLLRSTDLGDSWDSIKPEAMRRFDGEMVVVGNTIFCIEPSSAGRRMFRSVDAGDTWMMLNSDLINQRLHSMTALSEKMLYFGTDKGVYQSIDAGESWTKASRGITYTGVGDLVSSENSLFTVISDGIYKLVDVGGAWLQVNDGLIASDGAKASSEPRIIGSAGAKLAEFEGKVYVATCDSDSSFWQPGSSGIYCSGADERSWRPIFTNMPSAVNTVQQLLVSGETFYIIGNSGLYRWRLGEDRWTDLGLRILTEDGLAVSGKIVYAATKDGKLLRSVDEGDTWKNVEHRLPNWTLQLKLNYEQFVYDLHFVEETIYAGSHYAFLRYRSNSYYDSSYRVYRSTNGGKTWKSVIDNLDSYLDLHRVHDGALYGTDSGGGIFRLRHGSDAWEQIASIQRPVQSLAWKGDTLYAKTQAGIFRLSLEE